MKRSFLLLAATAFSCGGGSTDVPTTVVKAEVTSACAADGGCRGDMVSAGHCGPSVRVPTDRAKPVQVVTDRPASEVTGVVAVRHDVGDKPEDFQNGGSTRGWLLLKGAQARVEALHQPEVTLYTIGERGEPAGLNQQLLASDAGLVFRYTSAAGLVVTETHQVVETSPRPIEISSPGDLFNSCCASLPGRSLLALVALAAFLRPRTRCDASSPRFRRTLTS